MVSRVLGTNLKNHFPGRETNPWKDEKAGRSQQECRKGIKGKGKWGRASISKGFRGQKFSIFLLIFYSNNSPTRIKYQCQSLSKNKNNDHLDYLIYIEKEKQLMYTTIVFY